MTAEARLRAGRACCALCGQPMRPDEDAVVTPDFLADEGDPFWRFSDAAMHRACFAVWDGRKAFVARFNAVARRLVADQGPRPFMTAEGDVILR